MDLYKPVATTLSFLAPVVVTAATAASPMCLYRPVESTWATKAEPAPVPPSGTPGTTGAPIFSHKPDTGIYALSPVVGVPAVAKTEATAGPPILAYNPVASAPEF